MFGFFQLEFRFLKLFVVFRFRLHAYVRLGVDGFISDFFLLRVAAVHFLTNLSSGLPDGLFSKPKIPIWGNFGGSCYGKYWDIL
jgi:hypothetical protein